ncbi:hypothetical protein [Pseudomonas sp. SCB32]|uniref:hypothetical protein n=1 Tax=Pseudomonas sp. SCB32 TaxID=2653853 RepID=UPI0012656EFC|nr:hypothetical protein [Pseudomonas sp. SCB32]
MSKLPEFETVTTGELRELWRKHRDPDVRRLILEVERGRRQMDEVDSLYRSINEAYLRAGGGHLVALYRFKILLVEEKGRRGF